MKINSLLINFPGLLYLWTFWKRKKHFPIQDRVPQAGFIWQTDIYVADGSAARSKLCEKIIGCNIGKKDLSCNGFLQNYIKLPVSVFFFFFFFNWMEPQVHHWSQRPNFLRKENEKKKKQTKILQFPVMFAFFHLLGYNSLQKFCSTSHQPKKKFFLTVWSQLTACSDENRSWGYSYAFNLSRPQKRELAAGKSEPFIARRKWMER